MGSKGKINIKKGADIVDILDITRELGKEIQKDERYSAYHAAKKASDNDTALQNLIKELNLKKMAYEYAAGKDNNPEKLKTLEDEVNDIYKKIMSNENMKEYNAAKNDMDKLMNGILSVLNQCAMGEDPESCEPKQSCSGNCASCGGC